jgi:hypothetical protein
VRIQWRLGRGLALPDVLLLDFDDFAMVPSRWRGEILQPDLGKWLI